jgi:hypothetical protein
MRSDISGEGVACPGEVLGDEWLVEAEFGIDPVTLFVGYAFD